MTVIADRTVIHVDVNRESSPKFPFDNPVDEFDAVWAAVLALLKGGAREFRVRVGAVDVSCFRAGTDELVEAGDN